MRPGLLAPALFAAATLALGARGEEVTLYRDSWGVPHIYAATREGAAYAHGFAQAEDRLVDLLMNYRRATGRAASVLGPQAVDSDRLARIARHAQVARERYDELAPDIKAQLEGLRAHHSIAYSRQTLGFEFSAEEQEALKGAVHPLVRTNARTQRRSLYLASHASRIVDWPLPEGRLLLRDLIEHATQPQFVYRHAWRIGDLVIWDNRATMHRGRPFDDARERRELRRVTTLDV